VAHFFAFLLAIWGELSPPTSLTAAVAARIAESSFLLTMWEALKICMPITIMSLAIFIRSDMVVNPGWAQLFDTGLVAVGTCAITFATFGRFIAGRAPDRTLRVGLGLVALVVLFHPDDNYALAAAAIALPATIFGVFRHRVTAAPKAAEPMPQPAQ
jgi:TRAP-type uncharacterized transport system fused permease subunit